MLKIPNPQKQLYILGLQQYINPLRWPFPVAKYLAMTFSSIIHDENQDFHNEIREKTPSYFIKNQILPSGELT